jgi:hypothetical protein
LFISGSFHLVFLDHRRLQVSEILESETIDGITGRLSSFLFYHLWNNRKESKLDFLRERESERARERETATLSYPPLKKPLGT